jgi:hypothetical protein
VAKKYRLSLRKSPKSDPQQYLVYRMENEAIGSRHYAKLTRKSILKLVRSVCRAYGMPVPRIVFADLGRWAGEWHGDKITFNRNKSTAFDLITVTHELAHHLHHHVGDEDQESHGPQFMGCHMSILDTVRAIPVAAMRVVCKQYGVRYADPGDRNSLSSLRRAVRR